MTVTGRRSSAVVAAGRSRNMLILVAMLLLISMVPPWISTTTTTSNVVEAFVIPTSSSSSSFRFSSNSRHGRLIVPKPFQTSDSITTVSKTTTTITTTTIVASSQITTDHDKEQQDQKRLPYNWKQQWYALTFVSYIPNPSESAESIPASVFGHSLVLWKSYDDGPIYCADDVCPHRSAALSEGRVRNGQLECQYHGWQFEGGSSKGSEDDGDETTTGAGTNAGSCTFIPQLEPNATIPKRACLSMRIIRIVEGIVWVWMDETIPPEQTQNPNPPIQGHGLDIVTGKRKGFLHTDFQIDLPYDHSYLIENLIDPAHIPISHDRTPGGGKRESAEAYEMIVDESSISPLGFTGRYRTLTQQQNNKPYIEVEYIAPGIIRQKGQPIPNVTFGAALHCMPIAIGKSRLLFRVYFGGLPLPIMTFLKLKPTFLKNLNSCKILEQDVGLITTQEDHFYKRQHHKQQYQSMMNDTSRTLVDDFLLLKSSDTFVETYRKWMDRVGHGMPWYQGLVSQSSNVYNHLSGGSSSQGVTPSLDLFGHRGSNEVETRYHRHVMKCPSTRNALHNIQKLKRICIISTLLSMTMISILSSWLIGKSFITSTTGSTMLLQQLPRFMKRFIQWWIVSIPLSTIVGLGLHQLEQRFYTSFKRKHQLRTTETGV